MGDPRLRQFCEILIDQAAAYAASEPMRWSRVRLGSRLVRVTVPDRPREDGIDVLDGLLPHADDARLPDFELICFDGQGGVRLPLGTWPSDWHGPLGVVRAVESAPYRMSIDRHTQTITVFHPGIGKAAVWMWDFDLLPYWAAATPFRLALSWMADTFDGQFLHGACFARGEAGVLLVGRSGAGKSTIAFQARRSGFTLVSDDYLLLDGGRLHPLYSRAKLHESSRPHVPDWHALGIVNADAADQKRVIDLSTDVAAVPDAGVRVVAAAVPDRCGTLGIERTSAGYVFRHLAPYSLSGLLGGTQRSLMRLASALPSTTPWRWMVGERAAADMENLEAMWAASNA